MDSLLESATKRLRIQRTALTMIWHAIIRAAGPIKPLVGSKVVMFIRADDSSASEGWWWWEAEEEEGERRRR